MAGDMVKYLLVIPLLFFLGCMEQDSVESADLISAFDFDSGAQNWEGGISDYPINYEDSTDYHLSNIQVPSALLMQGKGLNISAENPHGDLFYYFKRHIAGLVPNTDYKLDFEFLVYTQMLEESSDLASEELYLKIGGVGHDPQLEDLSRENTIDYRTLNVDKGASNSDSGQDVINVGSIKEFTQDMPEVISGNTFDYNIEVRTDNTGSIWLVVGADSGIKSQLAFGMAALTVYYRQKN